MIARKEDEGWMDRLLALAQATADEHRQAVLVMVEDVECAAMRETSAPIPFWILEGQATSRERAAAWKRVEPSGGSQP